MSFTQAEKDELMDFIRAYQQEIKDVKQRVIAQLKTQSDEEVIDGYYNPCFYGRIIYENELNSRGIYM